MIVATPDATEAWLRGRFSCCYDPGNVHQEPHLSHTSCRQLDVLCMDRFASDKLVVAIEVADLMGRTRKATGALLRVTIH